MFNILAFFCGLLISPAEAQTCPTRPPGDSSNACASTAFVNQFGTGTTSGAVIPNLPVIGNATSNGFTQGTRSGNTTDYGTVNGTLTNGDCVSIDSNGNLVDAGGACTSGGTVSTGTAGQLAYYSANGSTVSGLGSISTGISPQITLGSDQSIGGSVVWDSAPVRMGSMLNLQNGRTDGNGTDEFAVTMQSTQANTPYYAATTSSGTPSSSSVLHLNAVTAGIVLGMAVSDGTTPSALQALQYVINIAGNDVTLSGNTNGSGVLAGDTLYFGFRYFKGPLFVATVTNDQSGYNVSRASNAITAYSEIGTGNPWGYAEGIVTVAQENGTGSGILIGGEFDILPLSTETNINCDVSGQSNCHTNIWVANFGTKAGSWMFDSAVGGPGWLNGIDIRNIKAGGIALEIPNNRPIAATNALGGSPIDLMVLDPSNNAVFGYGSASVLFYSHLSSGVYGGSPTVTGCGTGASISGTDTKGIVTIGSGTVTNCTVLWNTAYASAPVCVLTGGHTSYTLALFTGQPTTSGMSFNSSANMAGTLVQYICMQ